MTATGFDPSQKSKHLLAPIGGYEWSLQANFSEAKSVGGLGSTADADLCQAINCLLVGFHEPANRLLEQSVEWVKIAIDANERPQRYFAGATEAQRFQTLALCNWFLSNQHDSRSLHHFVEQEDRYLNGVTRRDKVGVSLTLLTYVNAGAFERTLEIFQSTPGLSAPTALFPRNEAQMAYVLCQHHLGVQYSRDDVETATNGFLTKNIDTWLSNGHAVRAAEWLKVLFWNDTDRSLSARNVLLKCYDYLPGRVPPA